MSDNRNIYLDYIRAISGIMVVLYHYTVRYEQLFGHIETWSFKFQYGSYGVLTFFVLSGYLTIRTINKTEPKRFAVRRFFRLYPSFFVSMIITMISTKLFLPDLAVDTKDFLLNFTMVPMLFGANNVDGAYWTLVCEISFYIVIFIICLFKWQKHIIKFIYGWLILQLFILMLPKSGIFELFRKANDLLYFHCFIIGSIIGLIEPMIFDRKFKWKLPDYGLFIVFLFAIFEQFISHEVSSGIFLIISSLVVIGAVVLNREKGKHQSSKLSKFLKPLMWVATISYPMYLLHQNIGYIIIRNMESIGLLSEFFIVIPISIILLLSWLVHNFVEKPIINFRKVHEDN